MNQGGILPGGQFGEGGRSNGVEVVRSSGEMRADSWGRALDSRSESWRGLTDLVSRKVISLRSCGRGFGGNGDVAE